MPYAFTEHEVTMLANLLTSEIAINMSITGVRAFIMLRQMVVTYKELEGKIRQLEKKYNKKFKTIYEALENLLDKKANEVVWNERERIGYKK